MSDFRCPRYWWDGSHWRCQNLPNDYLDLHDYDTYCTNKNRCLECPYMDSEVREKVAAYKRKVKERIEERVEENKREYEESDYSNKGNDFSSDFGSGETGYSSSSDSDTGCLGTIFALLWNVITFAFMCIIKFIPYLFLYFYMPVFATCTIYYFPIMILCGVLGLESLMLPVAIVATILVIISIPYWVILFAQKRKRKMKWKGTLKYYGKWLLKGPWAYKDIIELKKQSY